MKILNFGSLNIDLVYQVEHIARPGETIASSAHQIFAGGKGANQSAALARAGAAISHAGQVGPDGQWLIDKLADLGVDMTHTLVADQHTGHAIIQVDQAGQNSIVLYAGANAHIATSAIDATLAQFSSGDILLLQNEINNIPHIINQAVERGLTICLNPAPFDPEILDYPLDQVDYLIVNETEAAGLSERPEGKNQLEALASSWPRAQIVLTLGDRGAEYRSHADGFRLPAEKVAAVDTTAAGDTFIGYFLHGIAIDMPPRQALTRAMRAAAICVTRPGAMDSIPNASEID